MPNKILDWSVMGLAVGFTGTFGYFFAEWILNRF